MSTDKKNTYVIGSNNDLTNALNNIDYNRIGEDSTIVEWDGSQFLVKVGSSLEVNGNLYAVGTADETIAASSGVVVYNEATGWAISGDTPVLRADKGGYYLADGVTRVTRWDVLATGAVYLNASRQLFSEETIDSINANEANLSTLDVSGSATIDTLTIGGGLFNEAVNSSGNNSNGYWIRYESGMQVCWGERVSVGSHDVDIDGNNGIYRTSSIPGSFPVDFIDGNVVGTVSISSPLTGTSWTLVNVFTKSVYQANFIFNGGPITGVHFDATYFAIGYWK